VNYLRFIQCKEPGMERLREESKKEIIILFGFRLQGICQFTVGKDSIVGTERCYGLDCPRIEAKLGKFFIYVQTSPGANPASCKMGTTSFEKLNQLGFWRGPPNPI